MKTSLSQARERGLTLVELAVVITIISVLAVIFLSVPDRDSKKRAFRYQCLYNLKQIGVGSRLWAGDHNDKFPWQLFQTNGGTMEFLSGPNLWRHFQIMSNELSIPQIMFCPTERNTRRFVATNFIAFGNSNISYFIHINVDRNDLQAILAGDHNVTNGTPTKNGIMELTPEHSAGWTAEMHAQAGNVLLADGSVQQSSSENLRSIAGTTINRLLMPVLGP